MMEPPRSASDRIVEALGDEPDLDEVTRARMEKRLLAAVSAGAHLEAEDVVLGPAPDGATDASRVTQRRRAMVVVGTFAAAAAAVAVVWSFGEAGAPNEPVVDRRTATFQRYVDGETASRGDVAVGRTVETGASERIEVRIADARVDVTPDSIVRFVHLAADRVEVSLVSGAVEVELHPARIGDQTLRVTTDRAFVEVVGTVFRVAVDGEGDTHVSTVEGTVRVTPRAPGEPVLVSAGEEITVSSSELATLDEQRGEVPEAESPGPDQTIQETSQENEAPAVDDPAAPLESVGDIFARAEARLDAGDHAGGRRLLARIASTDAQAGNRVRAYTLLAESHASERDYDAAVEAYGDAVAAGGRSIGAENALFAMGRLFERQMNDESAATAAYRRYLELAPGGAHADHIHRALCGMGHEEHCQ
jgi:hypothetical protein